MKILFVLCVVQNILTPNGQIPAIATRSFDDPEKCVEERDSIRAVFSADKNVIVYCVLSDKIKTD